jgi:hypothetical protein
MRVFRRIATALLLPIVLLVPTVIGTVVAIVVTPPGHALLARIASQWITRSVAGSMEIGAVRGDIWGHIELDRVVVRDARGAVVLSSPRIEASYILPELLAHRLVFNDVRVDSLVLHLVRLRVGHWNYEQVFHLGEGPDDGKPPAHVALNGLRITDGFVQVDAPTTPGAPRQPASRNARMPSQPRIDTTADGAVQVYTFADLNANIRLLRISTPNRDPILADIAAMHVKLSDPDLTITQLAGRIVTANDSLRFTFDSASLPSSRLVGGGLVRWPHDTIRTDFTLDAPRVALRDLWWIEPDLPDWQGRGHIVATSFGGSRTDYRLDNLVLGNGTASVAGKVTLQVERVRGLGMRDLGMQLRNTPIDVLRPFLDTLPVSGALTGHLLADGFLDSLRLGGDLVFADAQVPGAPTSHVRPDGIVRFGGDGGAVFQQFRLNQSSIALGTVHHLVPSVLITGALRLTGELNGPWQDADFLGTAEHVAPDSSVSRMIGSVRLDTRATVLGLALDAEFDQLSFDALRSGYPGLPSRGGLTGHVIANGNLDSLDISASLSGEIGTFSASGRVKVNAPNYGADSLVVLMQRVDLQAVTDSGMSTALNGRVTVQGTIDSGVPPRGSLHIALDRSRFGGATVDAVTGSVHADHGMLIVDTGTVIWSTGRVDAHGTLGWAAPDSGTLTLAATATSLAPFDSLVRAITGLAADTLHPHAFDGQAHASLRVIGSVDAPTISGTVDGSALILDGWHATALAARFRADSLGVRGLTIEATVDTVGAGVHVADKLYVRASGKPDSLRVAGTIDMIALSGSGGGTWTKDGQRSAIQLDSMSLNFPHQGWRLARPTRLILARGQVAFGDTVRLRSTDGSGEIRVSGTTPGDVPGGLDASIRGLDLLDVFGVMERDSTALDGWGSLDVHLAGTRDAPTFNGQVSVISPVLGDLHAPSVQATFDYAGSRLRSTLSLWKTGLKVLDGTVSLPLDLALAGRANRKLDGPLQVSGTADSVDLVILAALIPSIENPTGLFSLNVKGNGTWAAPGLQGKVSVYDGRMFLPSLNVRYGPINGFARFIGDSLEVDSLLIVSADGQLNVDGGMRFAQLSKPTMNLSMHARDFLAIDVPRYLTLRATGDVRLTGPLLQPVLTGANLLVSRSVVYFGDLLTKNVINLDDPENVALVDLTELQRQQLRNEFSNRFLDSLRITDLRLRVGNEVWLRSAEANIQVQGELQVDKTRKVYALTGNLDTPRGTYTLRIGPINSDFTVDQGTVIYYGATNLDALLNISAHHQVRTLDGDDFNVVATITGSILTPKVDLSSPGRSLSDRDLASYVLFGRSESQLTSSQSGNGGAADAALAALTGALAAEIQRSLVGGRVTSVTFRPGLAPGSASTSSAATQFAAGLQFGRRWFVTFDAGFCASQGSALLQKRNFGASLEYRISRDFRFQAAAEPVQTCATNRAADVFTTLSRYQLGGNLLWQRDY